MFDCSTGVVESAAESEFIADGEGVFAGCGAGIADDSAAGLTGGAEGAGEMAGAAVGAGEAAGFAADETETGCNTPSAGGGAIETLARVFFPGAAAAEFEDPEAEAGETFE